MARTKTGFDTALTLISMFGFLVIVLDVFSNINLYPWSTTVLLFLAGTALMIEGNIRSIIRWGSNGIQGKETQFILTIVVGIFAIIAGILMMPPIGITSPQLDTITGLIAAFAFVFIGLQRWVLD